MKKIFLLLMLSFQVKAADFLIEVQPKSDSVGVQELKTELKPTCSTSQKMRYDGTAYICEDITSSSILNFASDVISAMSSTLSNYLLKSDIPNCAEGEVLTKNGDVYSCITAAADYNAAAYSGNWGSSTSGASNLGAIDGAGYTSPIITAPGGAAFTKGCYQFALQYTNYSCGTFCTHYIGPRFYATHPSTQFTAYVSPSILIRLYNSGVQTTSFYMMGRASSTSHIGDSFVSYKSGTSWVVSKSYESGGSVLTSDHFCTTHDFTLDLFVSARYTMYDMSGNTMSFVSAGGSAALYLGSRPNWKLIRYK